jgi:SAM-dependent methyltransferase
VETSVTHSEPSSPAGRAGLDLFLVSVLILFLELACIRWFPAHTLFLTFFTNTVLLACFLGMSVGCLCAKSKWDFPGLTPALLGLALVAGFSAERLLGSLGQTSFESEQSASQLVYFGAEYNAGDIAQFRIPVEVVNGFFFVMIALVFVGPGQMLGRSLGAVPDRVRAYTINIFGSLVGIVLFGVLSACHLSPFWWFLPPVVALVYFVVPRPTRETSVIAWASRPLLLALIPVIAGWNTGSVTARAREGGEYVQRQTFWSPYYRIDYAGEPQRTIDVNLLGHQAMVGRTADHRPGLSYALPHALNRDSGGAPFENVLVIGAGSGNDVSRVLQWGAKHVDAVEIDPVIHQLGKAHHPDKPYDDPRVTVHLDDGRNFLRRTDKKYDLVIYALVDSLVLHSSYSNIRLESYLFTREAFADVKRCLKPTGMFAMYNYFRQGWLVARLHNGLHEVFGSPPLVLGMPYQAEIGPGENLGQSFTFFLSGDTTRIRAAFAAQPEFWLKIAPPSPNLAVTPSGFATRPPAGQEKNWSRFGLANVIQPTEPVRAATDDWPFLYLRDAMIPDLTVRGILVMGGLALLLLYLFRPRDAGTGTGAGERGMAARMFFLGAAFMLIETKGVVNMALLFGSTWMVNSVVFFAVLVMILLANLYVIRVRPQNLAPYYVGLFLALALNVLVPLDTFLGMPRAQQVVFSCLLVFTPILFAGVIFAVSFARTNQPDRAFGYNIAGAMVGGLAENTSMLVGFQSLVLVAAGFYLLSTVGDWLRAPRPEGTPEPVAEAATTATP